MESEKTIHDVIKERMKLPEEVKSFIKINVFLNIIMAIVMLLATLIINIVYSKVTTVAFEQYIKFFQIMFAIVTVIFLEAAYKKDSFLISFYGMEMFGFSIAIMFVPYFYIFKNMLSVLVIVTVVFAVYYILKSIFTGIYLRNDYLKNNISDVKEIVKDNKKGYIDEESSKTLRENRKKEQEKVEEKQIKKNKGVKAGIKENNKKKSNQVKNKVEEQEKGSKKEYTAEGLNENLNKLKKMKEKKENNK